MPAWLPAAITAAASIGGNLLGSRQQRKNITRTNRANIRMADKKFSLDKKMADYQFSKQMDMWNRMNEYNSPVKQMQRMQEAGLNPNLMYGQGTVGNATQMAQYQAPQYNAPNLDYRGTPSTSANTLMSTTGAVADYLKLNQAKEQLDQASIKTWLDDELKGFRKRTEQYQHDSAKFKFQQNVSDAEYLRQRAKFQEWATKIEKIKHDFWADGISPADATWLRVGRKAVKDLNIPDWLDDLFNGLPSQLIKAIQ